MMSNQDSMLIVTRAAGNEYFRTALETPDYLQAVELRAEALRRRHSLPGVPTPPEPTDTTKVDAWLAAVAATAEQARAREAQQLALTQLINSCDSRIASAVMMEPDRLLRSLAEDLKQLMTDIKSTVNRLGDARTPTDAIKAGVGDIWNELSTLREAYDAIREAQEFVMGPEFEWSASRSNYLDDPHASDTHIANLDDVFPDWRDASRRHITMQGPEPDPRPWPPDPIEQLIWLAASDAKPWVPTTRQLDQLHAQRRTRRANPTPKVHRGRPDQLDGPELLNLAGVTR